jgi:signal transduction histidine kinase/CheY-like chemotaxis protein
MTDGEALIEAIREVFGLRASFDPGALPDAKRLALGAAIDPIYVDTTELPVLAAVRRFAVREANALQRRRSDEARLAELKEKTARLIPGSERDTSALGAWNLETAALPLLQRYKGWAVAVDGAVVRHVNLPLGDVHTTLKVLDREAKRSVPVRAGELYGLRVGPVSVVVLSDHRLNPIDRELVGLECAWLHRMLIEQENLRRLDRLSAELSEKNASLADAVVAAQQAAAAKASFLAHMSHELRTPLNGVNGLAQLLMDTPLAENQRELVRLQLESARWLRETIDAVLDLSKIEAGSMQLESIAFDLHELVFATLRGIQPLAQERGLRLEHDVAEDVPRYVEGDPIRIRQALLNLLSNALKFTPRGYVRARLRRLDGVHMLRFEVEDRGIGVPESRWDAVFDPFVQADQSTTRKYGGTGLGLPLVRRFARLHGGDAGVQSVVDEGSTFWFSARLPATAAPLATAEQVPEREPQAMRILVAEDQAVNQLIVRRMLKQRGHEVEVVNDGRAAVERLEQDDAFDLVLMDCRMPVLDGWTATTEIRALGPRHARLPIVALTASATAEEQRLCLDSGMNDVLLKPVQLDELIRVLHRTLGAAPLTRSLGRAR